MGHNAFVWCNCTKEAKTKPYLFDFKFWFDDDHFLTVEGGLPRGQRWQQVAEYLQTACEHPNFRQEDIWLCTSQTLEQFKVILHALGCEKFPPLCAYLPPHTYDGSITSEEAQLLLAELQVFQTYATIGQLDSLIHTPTNSLVWQSLSSYGSIFVYDERQQQAYGVNQTGFFIAIPVIFAPTMRIDPSKIVFKARHFTREMDPQGRIIYRNLEDQTTYSTLEVSALQMKELGYLSKDFWMGNGTFHVTDSQIGPDYFAELISSLIKICQASILTGNPIIWC